MTRPEIDRLFEQEVEAAWTVYDIDDAIVGLFLRRIVYDGPTSPKGLTVPVRLGKVAP